MGKRGGGRHARLRQARGNGTAELAGAAALLTAVTMLAGPTAEAVQPQLARAILSGGVSPLPGPQGNNWGYQAVCGPLGPQGGSGFGTPPGIGPQAFWQPVPVDCGAGAQGPQGFQGAQGAAGSHGPPNAFWPGQSIAPQGYKGVTGSAGVPGPPGAQGPAGPQGGSGASGPQGTAGQPGLQGIAGPQGALGPETPGRPARKVPKASRAQQAYKARRGLRVRREAPERKARRGSRA